MADNEATANRGHNDDNETHRANTLPSKKNTMPGTWPTTWLALEIWPMVQIPGVPEIWTIVQIPGTPEIWTMVQILGTPEIWTIVQIPGAPEIWTIVQIPGAPSGRTCNLDDRPDSRRT